MKYRINPNYSKIYVIAQMPSKEAQGVCPGVEGELLGNPADVFKTATGTLKLDVRRFSSSDKIRDFGVRTHVDVARHSFAELSQIKIITASLEPDGYAIQWQGTFKYRLKSPTVQGEAKAKIENGRLYVNASFSLPLKDVGLDTPRMVPMTSDIVRIEAKLEAIPI